MHYKIPVAMLEVAYIFNDCSGIYVRPVNVKKQFIKFYYQE